MSSSIAAYARSLPQLPRTFREAAVCGWPVGRLQLRQQRLSLARLELALVLDVRACSQPRGALGRTPRTHTMEAKTRHRRPRRRHSHRPLHRHSHQTRSPPPPPPSPPPPLPRAWREVVPLGRPQRAARLRHRDVDEVAGRVDPRVVPATSKEALITGEDGASQAAPHAASSAARPPPATQCLLLQSRALDRLARRRASRRPRRPS